MGVIKRGKRYNTPKMIIKIKKRDLKFTLTLFLIGIPLIIAGLLVTIPTVFAPVNRSFFVVELTIANRAPLIFFVNVTQTSVDLTDGGLTSFTVTFNASDLDGFNNLNHSSPIVNITLGGNAGASQHAANSSNCSITTYNANYSYYSCAVLFEYFNNNSGNWVINVSISDIKGSTARNDSLRITVNSLSAMRLVSTAVNFTSASTVAGTADIAASTNPFIVNNTGNFDFTIINVTGQRLIGVTTTTEYIGSGNFSINSTDNTAANGFRPLEDNDITLNGTTLSHGRRGIGNISLYFYVDVPTGLSAQVYNVTKPWEITLE